MGQISDRRFVEIMFLLLCVTLLSSAPRTAEAFLPALPWQNSQALLRKQQSLLRNGNLCDQDGPQKQGHYPLVTSVASHCLAGVVALTTATWSMPSIAWAAGNDAPLFANDDSQGIPVVTQSDVGKSFRSTIVRGAQFADSLDQQWERFSDSLRNENKCDPRTNRRVFDNGFRRDGTRIGNPVLGALCTPEPLGDLDALTAAFVLDSALQAAAETLSVDSTTLDKKIDEVSNLVGPAFSRAAASSLPDSENVQAIKRQAFNRDLYTTTRAIGEFVSSKEQARKLERAWGDKLLAKLAPTADRNDYTSPFPKPDNTEFQPYDEGALLDALGAVSVALQKLQTSGVIGHWEISIPEDDDWNVVTVAVDDDISIGGQILGLERTQPLSGSEVVSLMRSAMESRAKISYKMDTFFIDPTTTRQELYNPNQLLISLGDLGR